jgi:hypothetical protein
MLNKDSGGLLKYKGMSGSHFGGINMFSKRNPTSNNRWKVRKMKSPPGIPHMFVILLVGDTIIPMIILHSR